MHRKTHCVSKCEVHDKTFAEELTKKHEKHFKPYALQYVIAKCAPSFSLLYAPSPSASGQASSALLDSVLSEWIKKTMVNILSGHGLEQTYYTIFKGLLVYTYNPLLSCYSFRCAIERWYTIKSCIADFEKSCSPPKLESKELVYSILHLFRGNGPKTHTSALQKKLRTQ